MELTGIIDDSFIEQTVNATNANASNSNEFDSQMFLDIFLSQLQNQSPFDPIDTKDIAQQQAILTQVEQTLRQTGSLDDLKNSVNDNFVLLNEQLAAIKTVLENK